MNTDWKYSYSMFDFSKIFSFSVDMFANSDCGGDEVPDGVNDEAEDSHGQKCCPWPWLWEGLWASVWSSS